MLNLSQLKAKGIYVEGAKGVMAYDTVNGKIKTNFSKTALAMDSALQTTPNVGYPASFFQYIDPQIVEILFGVTNANRIAPEVKQGTWADEYYSFVCEEASGDVTAYSDRTEQVTTEVNYNFQTREQARFETIIQYGNLETDKANQAKIALSSRKQIAGANIIARKQNQFYLFGVSGKINHGLLNSSDLNPSVNPNTITVGGSTYTDFIIADSGALPYLSEKMEEASLLNSRGVEEFYVLMPQKMTREQREECLLYVDSRWNEFYDDDEEEIRSLERNYAVLQYQETVNLCAMSSYGIDMQFCENHKNPIILYFKDYPSANKMIDIVKHHEIDNWAAEFTKKELKKPELVSFP